MGRLLDLPDEILTYICISICDLDRVALFEVIHVNKKLHTIASPLLVRHWPLYRRISKHAHAFFAVHLLRNPHLQKNVKSIAFDNMTPTEPDYSSGNLQLGVLEWEDKDEPGHFQYAAPFFHLPKLKTLALSALSDKEALQTISQDQSEQLELGLRPGIYETRFPSRTSPIEELIIAAACLTSKGLLTVVSSCKRLKKLAFTCQHLDLHMDDHNIVLLKQAFLLHAASLEELAFKLEIHRPEDNYGSLRAKFHIGLNCLTECFEEMKTLKRLTMDIHALYFHDDQLSEKMLDRLPRSIEYLGFECELECYQPEALRYVEILCTVLEACGPGNRFCGLKTLELCLEVYGETDANIYDPVEELAWEKGIEFKLTRESQGWGTAWEAMGIIPVPNPPLANAESSWWQSELGSSSDRGWLTE
ncbi:hypothetical protein FNAPI_2968 [Fusarium napiforme]|uniref:F-box domain-containing protein n=1 Tax=Fusarium napiforme TaxID=42672 RepID=A0A8H5K0P3_9HYPO|nr:hypothetical protein FNAPI_2968 [Fusarium napiforme]